MMIAFFNPFQGNWSEFLHADYEALQRSSSLVVTLVCRTGNMRHALQNIALLESKFRGFTDSPAERNGQSAVEEGGRGLEPSPKRKKWVL